MMGELAALFTSLMWSVTSVQFTLAAREIGAQNLNRLRLVLAVMFLSVLHLVLMGTVAPTDVNWSQWGWLGLSGIVGLVLGDSLLFRSFVLIGPRQAMLLMTMAPILGALLAWVWLGETLVLTEIVAAAVTVGGIAWVVGERKRPETPQAGQDQSDRARVTGILMGLGAAAGQAVGLVLAKQVLADGFAPLSATWIRMVVASAGIWMLAVLSGTAGETWHAARYGKNRRFALGGAITGPTTGVWLSMVAVQHAPVGIASTLMALPPVLLIPLERWVFREPISGRAVAGTLVALCGAAVLFLV